MRTTVIAKVTILFSFVAFLAAAGDKVPQDVLDKPDFYVKMNMIENVSAIENLSDQDMKVVLNVAAPLPKTAQLEDKDTDQPEDQGVGQ